MKDDIRGTSIGYAINLIMDYGSGRQVTVAGCMPPETTLADFNRELDKLRLATNRQQAFVILRDRTAKLAAERKMVMAIEAMIAEYDKSIEEEMARLNDSPVHSTGQMRTQIKAQIENMRTQAVNFRMNKQQEIQQHIAEAEICETIIGSVKKEIADIDGEHDSNGG